MRIYKMGWFLKIITGEAEAITLAPLGIFTQDNSQNTLNHEKIHWRQQMEMLILFFYLWYFLEWFVRLFINGGGAYINLSFERETYENADNPDYLGTRTHFAWINYIRDDKGR